MEKMVKADQILQRQGPPWQDGGIRSFLQRCQNQDTSLPILLRVLSWYALHKHPYSQIWIIDLAL
jgi:hypothetical protein